MKKLVIIFFMIGVLFSIELLAQSEMDVKGGKDYPLISRFQDSVIKWYQINNFNRYYMLYVKEKRLEAYEITGKVTRIQYVSQKNHSVFEIFKSYEQALMDGGFKILLTLDKTNCGVNLSEQLYIGEFNGLNALPPGKSIKPDYRDGEFAYISAKKKISGKTVYIVVYITSTGSPLITFDAIEVKSLDKGLVSVKNLETDLKENGHIAIYGIYFDTGKATIKPESDATLKNIAKYLNAHPDQKFIIVGHTDNIGNFENNLRLSKERAEAVKKELVSKYSVNPQQLRTFGAANTSPVASNLTEKGRAKNRRVEIVEQ